MDKELLQRYVEGNVTPKEARTVVEWLDADGEHVREYIALHKLYNISVWNRAARQQPKARKNLPARKIAIELAKIAAVFLVVFAGIRYLDRPQTSPAIFHTLFVPAGQRAELTLSDNSKIWLNAQSRLVYPAVFEEGKREIQLDGEGFFEVAADAGRPFTVKTKAMDIQALGTEFNVIAYASYPATEIALLKGSVVLNPAGSELSRRMNVNECVRWQDDAFSASTIRNYDYFRWKEGIICFDEASVGSIVEKLELYFDVKIDVKKQHMLDYRYTGKFRTKDGVEQVLKVLQLEHKFAYTRDNEQNVITIK
ncbi:MAG: FecR domain-containing protein [Tannerella sp.]|jgi:ferric-dicitrate binding protein FerR (iron transport regulator)|nr:FecR domain-containing protein [Tannerella sp.]